MFLLLGVAFALASTLIGPVSGGWTLYPPLTTSFPGTDVLVFSVHTTGLSSLFGALNFVLTLRLLRACGSPSSYIPSFS